MLRHVAKLRLVLVKMALRCLDAVAAAVLRRLHLCAHRSRKVESA